MISKQATQQRKPPRLVTADGKAALEKQYADLGWDEKRQRGFNVRICGHDHPRTTAEAAKIYHALQAMLKKMFKPHFFQFTRLVHNLMSGMCEMSQWERGFLIDIAKKMGDEKAISPMMVKKVREVAHKYGVPVEFPSFRELGAAFEQQHAQAAAETPRRYVLKTAG